MHFTRLFSIDWDDSYNTPDFAIPGTFRDWIGRNEDKREKLADHLVWLADCLRKRQSPFGPNEIFEKKP